MADNRELRQALPDLRALTRAVLILATAIYGMALAPIVVVVPLALIGSGSPGSGDGPLLWLLVLATLTVPVTLVLAIILPWLCYRRHAYRPALAFTLLPLANVAIITLLFGLAQ